MQFVPVQPSDLSSIQYSFAMTEAKTPYDRDRLLMIIFQGVYGYGSGGNVDAKFMQAVVHFGCEAFTPKGIILDFRQLDYQWGDEMGFPIDAAHVKEIRPAILISDLCRVGMTSFVRMEMSEEPIIWLFEDVERAVQRVEMDFELESKAADYVIPSKGETVEQFEDLLRNERFRQIVAMKYQSHFVPPWLPFSFWKALILADAKESAQVFTTLAKDFLSRFEMDALEVFLEGLSFGVPPDKFYWLGTLPTPLLGLFLADIERRMTTGGTDALEKAHQLFSDAKQERIKRLAEK